MRPFHLLLTIRRGLGFGKERLWSFWWCLYPSKCFLASWRMHWPSLFSFCYRLCLRRPWWHCLPPQQFPTFRLASLLLLTLSTLHSLALSFKPTWAELSSCFVVLNWRCFMIVDDRRAMSSAESRSSSMVLKSHWIPVRSSLTAASPSLLSKATRILTCTSIALHQSKQGKGLWSHCLQPQSIGSLRIVLIHLDQFICIPFFLMKIQNCLSELSRTPSRNQQSSISLISQLQDISKDEYLVDSPSTSPITRLFFSKSAVYV